MSNFRFGADDYKLNYYPPEASDGIGGVDWDKVGSVEIEFDVYVKERTCQLTLDGTDGNFGCSECLENIPPLSNYCPNCGARVVEFEFPYVEPTCYVNKRDAIKRVESQTYTDDDGIKHWAYWRELKVVGE